MKQYHVAQIESYSPPDWLVICYDTETRTYSVEAVLENSPAAWDLRAELREEER